MSTSTSIPVPLFSSPPPPLPLPSLFSPHFALTPPSLYHFVHPVFELTRTRSWSVHTCLCPSALVGSSVPKIASISSPPKTLTYIITWPYVSVFGAPPHIHYTLLP
jgi:hypothetical protein